MGAGSWGAEWATASREVISISGGLHPCRPCTGCCEGAAPASSASKLPGGLSRQLCGHQCRVLTACTPNLSPEMGAGCGVTAASGRRHPHGTAAAPHSFSMHWHR